MAGVNVFAADSEEEALRLMTSAQQSITNRFRGRAGRLPPPVDDIETRLAPWERAAVEQALTCTVVGTPATVRRDLDAFAERHGADELMVTSQIHDHAARLRSYEIVAGA